MVLHSCSTATKMTVSTLPLILCISTKTPTTSCSKVPQGLRFPLGVRGLFTTRYFRKALVRDSNNLVKPFMQVVIHTTGYCATLSFLLLSLSKRKLQTIYHGGLARARLCTSPHSSDYIITMIIYLVSDV